MGGSASVLVAERKPPTTQLLCSLSSKFSMSQSTEKGSSSRRARYDTFFPLILCKVIRNNLHRLEQSRITDFQWHIPHRYLLLLASTRKSIPSAQKQVNNKIHYSIPSICRTATSSAAKASPSDQTICHNYQVH